MLKESTYNYAIDFWKLFFALMVVAYHKAITDKFGGIFQGGYIAVDFFFMVSGYFMVHTFMRRQNSDEKICVGIKTVEFIRRKFISIYPYIILSAFGSFIISCRGVSTGSLISNVKRLIMEILLLNMTGFSEGVMYVNWYISGLLLTLIILVPLLYYLKKDYICMLSPLLSILIYGWISQNIGYVRGSESEFFGVLRLGVWRGIAGVAAGSFCWYLADKLSEIRLNKLGKMIISIGIGISIIIIVSNAIFYPCSQQDFISIMCIAFLCIAIFSKQSLFYNLYNYKISACLREWSTSIFFMAGLGSSIACYMVVNLKIDSAVHKSLLWYLGSISAAGFGMLFVKMLKYINKKVNWKEIFIMKDRI